MKYALILAFLAAGCMGRVARTLKEDPSIVSVEISTRFGMQRLIRLVRVVGQSNEVTLTPHGPVTVNQKK